MAKQPRLSSETKAQVRKLHGSAIRRAVKAERVALRYLRSAVEGTSAALLSEVARNVGAGVADTKLRSAAIEATYRVADKLDAEFAAQTRAARAAARRLAQAQIAEELIGLERYARLTGQAVPTAYAVAEGAAVDGLRARQASTGMVKRWLDVTAAEITTWRRKNEVVGALTARLAKVVEHVDGSVRRHAVSQAHDAFADEKHGFWKAAVDAEEYDPDDPGAWPNVMFDVWTAVLDRKTCPVCMEADGQMVPVGRPFPSYGRPQIHPHCRCETVTIIVPEAAKVKLPGIKSDYEALKAEISDYVRGAELRHFGRRHAVGYIQESIQTSSPEALTRRLLERRFVDFPKNKAPRIGPKP